MSTFLTDGLAVATTFIAVLVITASSPIVSVVYLIGVFVLAASYLVCIGITYVGLTYLVVYVGAVAVLFLFVVMMFNVQHITAYGLELTKGVPLGAFLGVTFLLEALSVVPSLMTSGTSLLQGLYQSLNGLILGVANVQNGSGWDTVNLIFANQSPDSSFVYLSQVQSLGLTLYSHGSLWLIVIGLILLLAMLGPITLCLRVKA